MKRQSAKFRILLGIFFAPWLYIAIWTLPLLEHSAFHKWVVINTFLSYVAFLSLAGLSHLVLAKIKTEKLWAYCLVMFSIALAVDLVLSILVLGGYESNYYSQTQVVENGAITFAGYILQLKEALSHGLISAGVMAIFWVLAIFKSSASIKNA